MKVLVIGNGAREHTLAWKFFQSKRNTGVYVAPGNAGTEHFATNLPNISGLDPDQVIDACKIHGIDLVFVGPETPLSLGLVDRLQEKNILCVGPNKRAAQLESSKAFSKKFMATHSIPTAEAVVCTSLEEVKEYWNNHKKKIVVKMSGLAAGKGVLESDKEQEILDFAAKGLKEGPLVLEEFLNGYEVSLFALTDGDSYTLLPTCTDYKKAKDGNLGGNTGGMGAICPVPWVDSKLLQKMVQEIVEPTFEGFKKENFDYRGVVYFGVMVTDKGPKLLEYNVRFGDPEAQVLIPLILNDFCNLSEAIATKTLKNLEVRISHQTALGVVVASPGYPESYKKDLPVSLPRPNQQQLLFHASTYSANGTVYTSGGRCFTCVGLGDEILTARTSAYSVATSVTFPGAWFRKDIGNRVFGQ